MTEGSYTTDNELLSLAEVDTKNKPDVKKKSMFYTSHQSDFEQNLIKDLAPTNEGKLIGCDEDEKIIGDFEENKLDEIDNFEIKKYQNVLIESEVKDNDSEEEVDHNSNIMKSRNNIRGIYINIIINSHCENYFYSEIKLQLPYFSKILNNL
jgi:ABC-type multidrug transport system ATPase subunit